MSIAREKGAAQANYQAKKRRAKNVTALVEV